MVIVHGVTVCGQNKRMMALEDLIILHPWCGVEAPTRTKAVWVGASLHLRKNLFFTNERIDANYRFSVWRWEAQKTCSVLGAR